MKLRHQGAEKIIDTSKFPNTFAAWYSNVTHEVLPVESGYRWVLTYKLAIDSASEVPSASCQASNTQVARLNTLLRPWPSLPQSVRVPTHLYYVLDHKYTEANIGLRGLKHLDLARVQALRNLSREIPIRVFLAVVEKVVVNATEEQGYAPWCDEPDYDSEGNSEYDSDPNDRMVDGVGEELDSCCQVMKMVDLDGNIVLRNAAFNEENFLQHDCFDSGNADDEEFSGFTGNEVCYPLVRHVTTAMLIPY